MQSEIESVRYPNQNKKQPKLQIGITKRTLVLPNEQWPLSYLDLNKYHIDTEMVKQYINWHQNSYNRKPHQKYRFVTVNNSNLQGGGGG